MQTLSNYIHVYIIIVYILEQTRIRYWLYNAL